MSPEPQAPSRTVLELLTLAADYLGKKGVDHARRDADALLGQVLQCDRLHLYLRFEEVPTKAEVDLFRGLMLRRGEREPLQYLLGKVRFLGLTLACDKRALIPRPETEDLARLLRLLLGAGEGKRAADVGTGSGCLALSLAAHGAQVLATDLSPEALALAAENALACGLADRVSFAQGDALAPLLDQAPFDLLVSNPPYIAEGDRAGLAPEVADHEPALALFSGAQGLDLLQRLLAEAPRVLKPGGWLALECGLGQPAQLAAEARVTGDWSEMRTPKDSFDAERFLICQRA